MRAGLSLERRTPPCWSLADFGGPYSHAKPTYCYPLVVLVVVLVVVVVPVVVVVLALIVVADFGVDRGLSY